MTSILHVKAAEEIIAHGGCRFANRVVCGPEPIGEQIPYPCPFHNKAIGGCAINSVKNAQAFLLGRDNLWQSL